MTHPLSSYTNIVSRNTDVHSIAAYLAIYIHSAFHLHKVYILKGVENPWHA